MILNSARLTTGVGLEWGHTEVDEYGDEVEVEG